MRLKQSEIKSMSNETETLHQMVRQLDNQKTEARKRLDDLGLQVNILFYSTSFHFQNWQVDKLKQELETRKVKVEGEEKEMLVKKKELDQLKNEESLLVSKLNACKKEVDNLSSNLGQTQLQISQVKTQMVSLEEHEHQLTDGSKDLTAAIASKDFHNLTKLLSRPLTSPPELETVCQSSYSWDYHSMRVSHNNFF